MWPNDWALLSSTSVSKVNLKFKTYYNPNYLPLLSHENILLTEYSSDLSCFDTIGKLKWKIKGEINLRKDLAENNNFLFGSVNENGFSKINLSDGYFESRPTGSKLGAWASNQSSVVNSREELDKQLRNYQQEFKSKEIERPPHWGGFLVKPISIEFWQGRSSRLHDRLQYRLDTNRNWVIERLAP